MGSIPGMMNVTRWVRLAVVVGCVCGGFLWTAPAAQAQGAKRIRETESKPADYSSKNFLVHTDLPADEAKELLKRLETMLSLISKYWGRPPSGIIEMYVMADLKKWKTGELDPNGVGMVRDGGGLTISRTLSSGNQFLAKAIVYAGADHGTPQHEAVHAYCAQTFGRTGPVWYAEGMAEMGQYWLEGDASVNCHEVVVQYLKQSDPKPLTEIVEPFQFTGDSWQNYAWRWALCHLLANNPNYAPRFRPLGLGLLQDQDMSFESVYGPMAKEISFEYLFFLQHFDRGYRVDLCGWDWKAKFQSLKTSKTFSVTIDAAKGWQASKCTVADDQEYEYSVAGTWRTSADGEQVSADGAADGKGKLVGIIFDDYKLSEPFELGTFGSFTPPESGDLYLRCQDEWTSIANNKGKLGVRIKPKGKGSPLPPPKESTAAAVEPAPADDDETPKKAPAVRKPSKTPAPKKAKAKSAS